MSERVTAETISTSRLEDAMATSPPVYNTADVQEQASLLYRGEMLAPMVRASTTPLRTLALRYGADAVYTEELIDRSITGTRRVKNTALGTIDYIRDTSQTAAKTLRKMARDGSPPLLLRIDPEVERGKLICQIGSGEPELALASALHVHQDVDALDINMGCPKKFSVSGGMGSALLSDPDRACRILRMLRDQVPHKPVSAKIRLLSDNHRTMDFITGLIERGGTNAVAIHGRTVGHDSVDPADWTRLEEIVALTKSKFPQIPVLINGDFYTRQEFLDFQEKTGAQGVLLGRPALYNTSIFRKPAMVQGEEAPVSFGYDSPLLLDKTLVIQDYMREAVRYDIHYKNIKYVVCEMMNNRRAPSYRVHLMPQKFPGFQTINKVCASQSLSELCAVWNLDYQLLSTVSKQPAAENFPFTSTKAQAPAGEHKYDDQYLLQTMGPDVAVKTTAGDPNTNVTSASPDSTPPAKRTRVET